MIRVVLTVALVAMFGSPSQAKNDAARSRTDLAVANPGGAAMLESATARDDRPKWGNPDKVYKKQKSIELVEIADSSEYKVDPNALTVNPDYAGLKSEIENFIVKPCYYEILRLTGVRKALRKIMVPKMMEAAEKEIGGIYDLMIDQLRNADRKTRAELYEANYEHCLTSSGAKSKG